MSPGFAAPEGVEHLSGGVVADRAFLNALDDLRQLLRRDLGRFDVDFFGIQAFGDFAHDPVAGEFGLPAFLRGLLEIGRHLGRLRQRGGVIFGQAVIGHESLGSLFLDFMILIETFRWFFVRKVLVDFTVWKKI